MKKWAVLFLAAGLVFGAAQHDAQAADIRISGEWDFNTEWNDISFSKDKTDDLFHARQRLRTQVDVIASESLKGTVFFEIGDTNWGSAEEGGALGTDGKVVEVRYSYIDWVVPQTDLKVRMGLQPFSLPNFVAGDPIMGSDDSDGAGITLSYQFNDTVGASLFWLRAENDNSVDDHNVGNAMDFVGLSVPMAGSGWQLNPWGMYGNLGKNSLKDVGEGGESLITGLLPYGQDGVSSIAKDSYSSAWWLGIGGEVTLYDPLRLALDFAYGKADWGKGTDGQDLTRQGWLVSGLAEYKLDSMTPGLIAWYGSGDDSNVMDGSERMPTLSPGWAATTLGWDGAYGISDGAIIGNTPVGTWGVVARLADISFIDDLTHTLAVGYYTGTNDTAMVRRGPVEGIESGNVYLTTKDHAWEVNFDSQYKIYENLTLATELGFVRLDLDGGVWGSKMDGVDKNAYKVGLNLNYAF